jgi:hypothetical protein
MHSQNSRMTYNSQNTTGNNYKGTTASGGARENQRKIPSSNGTETTANTSHDYNRKGQGNQNNHQAQIMGMTGGFSQQNGQHMRYQSQLSQ